jgi:hypothetical protein
MHIDELKTSRFLKKEDCEEPLTVTIDHVEKKDVAEMGEAPELKWCLLFRDGIKPMVLNSTNGQLIARALGSKNSEDWVGKQIELFCDPNVIFGGALVGGIRVRPATKPAEEIQEIVVDL